MLSFVARQYPGSISSVISVVVRPLEVVECSITAEQVGMVSFFLIVHVSQVLHPEQTAANLSPGCDMGSRSKGHHASASSDDGELGLPGVQDFYLVAHVD